ncbi:hypothetical protein V1477_019135, partial [Vespula maculifrons]
LELVDQFKEASREYEKEQISINLKLPFPLYVSLRCLLLILIIVLIVLGYSSEFITPLKAEPFGVKSKASNVSPFPEFSSLGPSSGFNGRCSKNSSGDGDGDGRNGNRTKGTR